MDALASGSGDRWHVVFVSALASSCGDRWQVSLATIHSLYTYSNELCEVSAQDENGGIVQDVLLHETSVSWFRKRLEQSTPKKCWEETREAYSRRLKRCCDAVSDTHLTLPTNREV